MRRRRKERATQYRNPAYRELQQRLASNVRRLRADLGLTQEEAAERCQMSARLFQRCEAGDANTTLTTVARLSEGFEVDVLDLFAHL